MLFQLSYGDDLNDERNATTVRRWRPAQSRAFNRCRGSPKPGLSQACFGISGWDGTLTKRLGERGPETRNLPKGPAAVGNSIFLRR